jgi:hypothetical protein
LVLRQSISVRFKHFEFPERSDHLGKTNNESLLPHGHGLHGQWCQRMSRGKDDLSRSTLYDQERRRWRQNVDRQISATLSTNTEGQIGTSDLQASRCGSDGRNGNGCDAIRSLGPHRVGRARRLRRVFDQE